MCSTRHPRCYLLESKTRTSVRTHCESPLYEKEGGQFVGGHKLRSNLLKVIERDFRRNPHNLHKSAQLIGFVTRKRKREKEMFGKSAHWRQLWSQRWQKVSVNDHKNRCVRMPKVVMKRPLVCSKSLESLQTPPFGDWGLIGISWIFVLVIPKPLSRMILKASEGLRYMVY